jgi:hypothetical protein
MGQVVAFLAQMSPSKWVIMLFDPSLSDWG